MDIYGVSIWNDRYVRFLNTVTTESVFDILTTPGDLEAYFKGN